jgi:CheY-like chemotaxis protein
MAVILLVEDDPFVRILAEAMIEEFGHEPLSANDVDEALGLLRSERTIDALVTDIRLVSAMLGGFELAREAIRIRPNLPVLYVTGNSMTAQMKALFVEGGLFLQKPYSEMQFQHSVERLLATSA